PWPAFSSLLAATPPVYSLSLHDALPILRIACQKAGFDPRIVHEAEEQSTSLAMVAGGLGVSLVSDLALTPLPAGVDIVALAEPRSEEHTSELQSRFDLVCRLLLEHKQLI